MDVLRQSCHEDYDQKCRSIDVFVSTKTHDNLPNECYRWEEVVEDVPSLFFVALKDAVPQFAC